MGIRGIVLQIISISDMIRVELQESQLDSSGAHRNVTSSWTNLEFVLRSYLLSASQEGFLFTYNTEYPNSVNDS